MPTNELKIADGVRLPLDAITRTFAALGQRGTGKTSAAVVIAEEMLHHGGHVVILDPVGVHWGITRPGTGRGYPGVIIGGEHADVPLEETAGALVAELVVGRHWPVVVVDMKLLRKGAQRRFMADFLEGVYFHNREPLHVIFEEADQALPQTPRGMDPIMGRVLGAGEDIVKLGRSRGLGVTLVSQRPATVNKNVLEQVETLLLFRLMGPRDRKSAREWVEANADPASEKQVMDSLASLQRGECWLWSPGWLRLLQKIQVRARRTFDSSATPEVGEKLAEPKARAPIDLDVLRQRMADTIERAKADDPKALRARIRELEKELKDRPGETKVETVTETVEVPAIDKATLGKLEDLTELLKNTVSTLAGPVSEISAAVATVSSNPGRLSPLPSPAEYMARTQPPPRPATRTPAPAPIAKATPNHNGDFTVTTSQQRILDALAMLEHIGIPSADKTQLALFAGTKPTSGGYKNNLGALRNQGALIEYPSPGTVALTAAGRDVADAGAAPDSTEELHDLVMGMITPAQWAIVSTLIDVYPDALTREELAERVQVPSTSGGFKNNLGRMRSTGLIDYPGSGLVAALPVLFLEGRR